MDFGLALCGLGLSTTLCAAAARGACESPSESDVSELERSAGMPDMSNFGRTGAATERNVMGRGGVSFSDRPESESEGFDWADLEGLRRETKSESESESRAGIVGSMCCGKARRRAAFGPGFNSMPTRRRFQ